MHGPLCQGAQPVQPQFAHLASPANLHLTVTAANHGSEKEFLADLAPPGSRVPSPPRPATAPGVAPSAKERPEGGPVFEALREWRLARARADAKPPYVIAHDATLLEVERRLPRTMAELRRVPGMGPVKVETYGEEILAVVRVATADR